MERIEVKFAADEVAKTGEFAGYGAIFGNVDSHGDIIVPGAFAETLNSWGEKGRYPSMKLMHGSRGNLFTGDDLPIGKWTVMREDQKGLYVEGKLSALDTDIGKRVYGLMKDGVLDGLSIGYRAKKSSKEPGSGPAKRKLEIIDLAEISLVDTPSNDVARISDVKAAEDIKTIREFEEFLRDVGGFSNAQAKAIATLGFKAADPRDEDGAGALAESIRRNITTLVPKG